MACLGGLTADSNTGLKNENLIRDGGEGIALGETATLPLLNGERVTEEAKGPSGVNLALEVVRGDVMDPSGVNLALVTVTGDMKGPSGVNLAEMAVAGVVNGPSVAKLVLVVVDG